MQVEFDPDVGVVAAEDAKVAEVEEGVGVDELVASGIAPAFPAGAPIRPPEEDGVALGVSAVDDSAVVGDAEMLSL